MQKPVERLGIRLKSISSSPGYSSEQPSEEYAIGLIKTILGK
ncbi:hypothetical protein [Candidatus Nitrosocosmicus sp. R]